jgi:adenylate cyclase
MDSFKRNLQDLAVSVLAWIAALGLYILVRFYGTQDTMDWATTPGALFVLALAVGAIFGVLYWLILLLADSKALRRHSYGFLIAFKCAGLFLAACVIVLVSRVAAYLQGSIPLEQVVPSFFARFSNGAVIAFFLYVTAVALAFSLIRQMSMMVGTRVLLNLMLGKYHAPKEEDRIFMFLDMRGSTTHAERLGPLTYCRLVQDCFNDLTDSALAHEVEIYQYAGDEAILTWRVPNGLRNANCVAVFFQFDEALRSKADYYRARYGIVPEFKAGVNLGTVTAAEIGVLKRDIAYFSDVLNTAARIQSKCNEFGRRLLISGALRKMLGEQPGLPAMERIGELVLKGKENLVEVYAVGA